MITARIWREIPQRYRLEAAKCRKCDKLHYPPRRVCDECKGRGFEAVRLADRGTVETFSVVRSAHRAFVNQIPLVVAIVRLEDGARLTLQVTDVAPEEMKAGMPVRLEFRKIQQDGLSGVISYGHKAVPVE